VSEPSLVMVLAEDERHQRFVRRFLRRRGLSLHLIRMEPLPSGRGCGEQWVRDRYSAAVRAYRARAVRAKTELIVAIDADQGNLDQRCKQLREALTRDGETERRDDEKILHFIPKRAIETWVLFLSGRSVDEDTDYSRGPGVDDLIAGAADSFFGASRVSSALAADCIPSLLAAIGEVRRLD